MLRKKVNNKGTYFWGRVQRLWQRTITIRLFSIDFRRNSSKSTSIDRSGRRPPCCLTEHQPRRPQFEATIFLKPAILSAQPGNCIIFPSFRFYVKSMLLNIILISYWLRHSEFWNLTVKTLLHTENFATRFAKNEFHVKNHWQKILKFPHCAV